MVNAILPLKGQCSGLAPTVVSSWTHPCRSFFLKEFEKRGPSVIRRRQHGDGRRGKQNVQENEKECME
jgi:hypothetical protein